MTRAELEQIAREAAAQYNLPVDVFLRLIQQESGFDPSAVSPKGALGPAQLMPDTAKELGVDPRNVRENIFGGAKYLSQQLSRFGQMPLALAAYNAGPTRVARLGRIPNIPETQNYVKSILGSIDGQPLSATRNNAMVGNMQTPPIFPQQQPQRQGLQGLLQRFMQPNETTGLTGPENFAQALDALILPEARMGEQIRARGAQRLAQGSRNETIKQLERMAKDGDPLATELLAAVRSRAISPADAYKTLLSKKYDMSGDKIRSSVKFQNGAYYVITDKGRKVYNKEGILVPDGPQAAEVLREAELSGIAMEGLTTGITEAAKFQQKSANAAFEKAEALTAQISTIDRAIAEIDGGAKRNVILNLLPDITAKAGGLNSALRQMGLDIVSSVTFGALSQSELDIAMSTAYPPNANEQELRVFLAKRKEALEKLRSYTEEAASFLLNPNNTKADWMEIVKSRRDQQASEGMTNPYMGMSVEQLNVEYTKYAQMTEIQKTQFRDALKAAQQNQ
jgi:hypothetical protein